MNTTPRICAFLSKGRNFVEILKSIRSAYPNAPIDAVIPHAYPLSDEERALVDRVVETEKTHYSPRDVGPLYRLVRQLRAPHYNLFVVMFDSPKLRLLARLSNAKACTLHRLDHRMIPIHPSTPRIVADVVFRNLWGRVVYGYIWLLVHLLRANKTQERA